MKTPVEIVIDQIRSGNTDPLNILKALFGKDVALVFTDPFIHDAFNTIDHILGEYYTLYDMHDSDIRTAVQTVGIICNMLENKYVK